MDAQQPQPEPKKRGFAAMDPEKHREIASKAGKASAESGRGHRFKGKKAQAAGRKGGLAVSEDREHMSEIGTKGGRAPKRKRG